MREWIDNIKYSLTYFPGFVKVYFLLLTLDSLAFCAVPHIPRCYHVLV